MLGEATGVIALQVAIRAVKSQFHEKISVLKTHNSIHQTVLQVSV